MEILFTSLLFPGDLCVSCCSYWVSNLVFCKGDEGCEFCLYLEEWGKCIVAGGVFVAGDEGGMRVLYEY